MYNAYEKYDVDFTCVGSTQYRYLQIIVQDVLKYSKQFALLTVTNLANKNLSLKLPFEIGFTSNFK